MFSPSVELALREAHAAHEGQLRKGLGAVPYFTHPVHVALILARLGCDDTLIAAGILHDLVEDCEGWTLDRIEAGFGAEVRSIVAELTEDKRKSWEERKADGIRHVSKMSPAAATVKAADKLHNLRCLLADLEHAQPGQDVWSRFRGGRERTLETSNRLVCALEVRVDPRLGRALRSVMDELTARE